MFTCIELPAFSQKRVLFYLGVSLQNPAPAHGKDDAVASEPLVDPKSCNSSQRFYNTSQSNQNSGQACKEKCTVWG